VGPIGEIKTSETLSKSTEIISAPNRGLMQMGNERKKHRKEKKKPKQPKK